MDSLFTGVIREGLDSLEEKTGLFREDVNGLDAGLERFTGEEEEGSLSLAKDAGTKLVLAITVLKC